jgi:mRNA-degrading endonuclease RelE of RelBE toxin-antitoxin system
MSSYQVIFNEVSAAELAALPVELQLEIMREFNVVPEDLDQAAHEKFGRLERDGRHLLRFRAKDYRIYFEKKDVGIEVHRVLHKNSLKDFLFRSKFPVGEDEALQKNPDFWKLIDQRKN